MSVWRGRGKDFLQSHLLRVYVGELTLLGSLEGWEGGAGEGIEEDNIVCVRSNMKAF